MRSCLGFERVRALRDTRTIHVCSAVIAERLPSLCWLLRYCQKHYGNVPKNLVVDVSQTVSRMPWTINGLLPSPTTNSKIWYDGKVLSPKLLAEMLGWPRESLKAWHLVPETNAKVLIGNIISTPVIGGIFLAMLSAAPLGSVDARIGARP